MNLDPLLEQLGLKRPGIKPTWLDQLSANMGIIEDPDKKEWWKNFLIAPASTLTAEYGGAAALLPYKKLIERPAISSRWAIRPNDVDFRSRLKALATKLNIHIHNTPANSIIPQVSDSFTLPNASSEFYTANGNLKSNWKKFTSKDILSPDKWFLRQSTNLPTKLDVSKYNHIIAAPGNIHPGMLAKEIGSLAQNPIFRKMRTQAEILSILGIGAPTITNDESTSKNLAAVGTAAQLPLLAAELDAASKGSEILRRVGAKGNKVHFPYLGIPAYALTTAMPSLAFAAKKHLFGGFNDDHTRIHYPGFDQFTTPQDTKVP